MLNTSMTKGLLSLTVLVAMVVKGHAGAPCRSGLEPGKRPGPYAAVVSTGPERGRSHCYICATEDRPAFIVFARNTSEPLGKLAQQLDKALSTHTKEELRGWVTFLNTDQTAFDPLVVAWGQKHALRTLPLAVFEDPLGPPSYRLSADADITILLFVRQKVVANFAFRSGELTDAASAEVIKALPRILKTGK